MTNEAAQELVAQARGIAADVGAVNPRGPIGSLALAVEKLATAVEVLSAEREGGAP